MIQDRSGGSRRRYSPTTRYPIFFAIAHAAFGVVTGKSATTHVSGESFWEHMRQHPEENEIFNRALAELRGDEHQQVADAYDWVGVNTLYAAY